MLSNTQKTAQTLRAAIPSEIVALMVGYLSGVERIFLIAIFPRAILIYRDELNQVDHSVESTLHDFLSSKKFVERATRLLLLEIVGMGFKNTALITCILDYALNQLHGLYSGMYQLQNSKTSVTAPKYQKEQRNTQLFFNFVSTGYFARWIKTSAPSSELVLKYKRVVSCASFYVKKKSATSSSASSKPKHSFCWF